MKIDTSNFFGVHRRLGGTSSPYVAVQALHCHLNPDDALVLSAWLLAAADPEGAALVAQGNTPFQRMLHQIMGGGK